MNKYKYYNNNPNIKPLNWEKITTNNGNNKGLNRLGKELESPTLAKYNQQSNHKNKKNYINSREKIPYEYNNNMANHSSLDTKQKLNIRTPSQVYSSRGYSIRSEMPNSSNINNTTIQDYYDSLEDFENESFPSPSVNMINSREYLIRNKIKPNEKSEKKQEILYNRKNYDETKSRSKEDSWTSGHKDSQLNFSHIRYLNHQIPNTYNTSPSLRDDQGINTILNRSLIEQEFSDTRSCANRNIQTSSSRNGSNHNEDSLKYKQSSNNSVLSRQNYNQNHHLNYPINSSTNDMDNVLNPINKQIMIDLKDMRVHSKTSRYANPSINSKLKAIMQNDQHQSLHISNNQDYDNDYGCDEVDTGVIVDKYYDNDNHIVCNDNHSRQIIKPNTNEECGNCHNQNRWGHILSNMTILYYGLNIMTKLSLRTVRDSFFVLKTAFYAAKQKLANTISARKSPKSLSNQNKDFLMLNMVKKVEGMIILHNFLKRKNSQVLNFSFLHWKHLIDLLIQAEKNIEVCEKISIMVAQEKKKFSDMIVAEKLKNQRLENEIYHLNNSKHINTDLGLLSDSLLVKHQTPKNLKKQIVTQVRTPNGTPINVGLGESMQEQNYYTPLKSSKSTSYPWTSEHRPISRALSQTVDGEINIIDEFEEEDSPPSQKIEVTTNTGEIDIRSIAPEMHFSFSPKKGNNYIVYEPQIVTSTDYPQGNTEVDDDVAEAKENTNVADNEIYSETHSISSVISNSEDINEILKRLGPIKFEDALKRLIYSMNDHGNDVNILSKDIERILYDEMENLVKKIIVVQKHRMKSYSRYRNTLNTEQDHI